MLQVYRGFQLFSKKYSNSFDGYLFVDSMANFMYHIIDDIETLQEENYLISVLEDWIVTEKENTLNATRQSSSYYDAIDIPDTDIFHNTNCDQRTKDNDEDTSTSVVSS